MFWQDGNPFKISDISQLAGNFPASRISLKKKKIKFYNADHDLFWGELEIPGFRMTMFIPESGLVFFTFKMGTIHRGIDAGSPYGQEYPIGLGARVMFRRALTQGEEGTFPGSFTYFDQSIAAGQIMDFTHRKYTHTLVRVPMAVTGNYMYEFTLSGGSHTNAGSRNGQDGSAEINPSNQSYLLVEYEGGRYIE